MQREGGKRVREKERRDERKQRQRCGGVAEKTKGGDGGKERIQRRAW